MPPSLHCPTCGAPLPAPSAMQFTCSYCHTVLGITALPPPPDAGAPVVRLYGPGHGKINTIKAVRELTGLGLKESKDLVEGPMPVDLRAVRPNFRLATALADLQAAGAQYEVLGEAPQPSPNALPVRETASLGEPNRPVVTLVDAGPNKIEVIKTIRMVTGLGLAESKELCDRTPSRFRVQSSHTAARVVELFQRARATVRIDG